jgi:hypothetical protein
MARLLDPLVVYHRGLAGLDRLEGVERLVFMLQDFDNLMEMEGWGHFYLNEHHFAWYAEMKNWLHAIGAAESVALLDDYETHVRSKGFEVSPAGIEAMERSKDEAYSQSCPDWCGRYCALREDRWAKATALLMTHDVVLRTAEPLAAADSGAQERSRAR